MKAAGDADRVWRDPRWTRSLGLLICAMTACCAVGCVGRRGRLQLRLVAQAGLVSKRWLQGQQLAFRERWCGILRQDGRKYIVWDGEYVSPEWHVQDREFYQIMMIVEARSDSGVAGDSRIQCFVGNVSRGQCWLSGTASKGDLVASEGRLTATFSKAMTPKDATMWMRAFDLSKDPPGWEIWRGYHDPTWRDTAFTQAILDVDITAPEYAGQDEEAGRAVLRERGMVVENGRLGLKAQPAAVGPARGLPQGYEQKLIDEQSRCS